MSNPTSIAEVIHKKESTKEKINTSVNVNVLKNNNTNHKSHQTLSHVRLIADKLSTTLNNPGSYNFYCKIAWHLPEGVIWYNLESAQNGKEPVKLFSWLCNQSLRAL